ncbi:hypothetical protein ES965_14355 [Bacillus subtilis]|uniref:hypothetical protein n=1 Tax=Bacillus subtilis TaxID=1423 RepID=UPI00100A1FA7|nr:hypothetical protein [Bacillus subtilis]QAV85192.1 hypothetical protein ES965_14355 [Bacillus subtilis]WJD91299.1 hypothetical protein QR321_14285 [Bacillus spizizenii]
MTETNAKIHVLADETLGGIKREYVEVDRKAGVGEKIVIVARNSRSESYENGEIFTVERVWKPLEGDIESDEAKSITNGDGLIFRSEYRVLEPTNIVHIDGQRYEMVDREAEVGETIVITSSDYEEHDEIYVAGHRGKVIKKNYWPTRELEVDFNGFDNGFIGDEGIWFVGKDSGIDYRVLVPAETTDADEPQPADLIDVVSKLADEVAKLKRKDDEDSEINSRVFAKLHDRISRLQDEIDTLHKDNRTHGEELARLKEPAKSESIIESVPFMLVIHEGRGEFDVYQRGKKIENISRLEIEAYSRLSSSINLEFNDVGERP